MQLKALLICGVIFSLTSCKDFPAHERCTLNQPESGADCFTTSDPENTYNHKTYDEMDKWTCVSPETDRLIVEWIKNNCKDEKVSSLPFLSH